MKKLVLSILFISVFGIIQSQVTFKPGVRLGLNIASVSNIDDGSKIGLNAGVFGELKLGRIYALQPEINYSKQGSEHLNLEYLSIKLANKFYILSDEVPVFIVIAPGIDFNLNSKTHNYSTNYSTGVIFNIDFSFSGGIGYDFPFGLGVDARYKQGIVNVFEFTSDNNYLNNVIQLSASYKFDFGR